MTNANETTLNLRCTVCSRALRAIVASNIATEIHRQTCRGCKAPHVIKTMPHRIPDGWAHVVSFNATRSPSGSADEKWAAHYATEDGWKSTHALEG